MLPYRSVLVTGAGGFVGSYLVAALRTELAEDAIIHRVGRDPTGGIGGSVDLLDAVALRGAIIAARPDLVIHLAAQSSVGQSGSSAADTWRVNVGGTLNLAGIVAAEAPGATVAFASSSEVYGAAFNAGPVDEDTLPRPLSVYARTKRAAEDVLRDTLAPTNRLAIFRPANHSGAGQDVRFVLPAFAEQIAAIEAGRTPPVIRVGSLDAERDFLDVRDVVAAYLRVLALPDLVSGETFNIASERCVAIGDILDALLSMAQVGVTVEQDAARLRPSEVPRTSIDAGRIRTRTLWRPERSLRDTIADVLADQRRRQQTICDQATIHAGSSG